ncbi:DUF6115 domain-containing protein [Jeotgalibacillus soli]|uniref:Coupling factor for flagellin transcription and translation n=1 Tax=Jeotgalibacillus soli TaxID=889306 RepID=A0A0C2VLM9_9BACL|nr:hypothetical protein [Jeotgalibacillus soli]KIL44913.1 hypothetical protein KP78_24570 [Jeotgalibacillus soli]
MTYILLVISILFNLTAFLAIYLLFLRQNRLLHIEQRNKQSLKEIEETFTSYIYEIKEENTAFLKQFEQLQDETDRDHTDTQEKSAEPELVSPSIQRASRSLAANRYRKMASSEEEHAEPVSPIDIIESMEETVIRMNNEGFSIADIAKTLNKGQTEIELMLKFQKKAD